MAQREILDQFDGQILLMFSGYCEKAQDRLEMTFKIS